MGSKYDDEALKRYLLGKSDTDEQADLEQKLVVDTDCFEQLMVLRDELYEEYLDNELASEDRKAFEECILSTPDGQKELRFTANLRKVPLPAVQKKPVTEITQTGRSMVRTVFKSALMRMAATVLITLGSVFIVWRAFFYQSELSLGMKQFKRAFSSDRPLEARISDLDNYNSMPDVKRGGVQDNNIDCTSQEL